MKNCISLVVLICCALNIRATHIVGGELNYQYLGGWQYAISLTVYRDCYNGIPPFDNPAALGIFDVNNNLVQNIMLNFIDLDTLPPTINNPCFIPPTNVCYEVTTYHDTLYLPPIPGGYQIAYQRCCRNNTINNIVSPGATGATYYATIPDTSDITVSSNPVFTAWPPPFLCANTPFSFDHSATDADGDSLVYSLFLPFNGANQSNPMPQPPYNPPYGNIVWASGYSTNAMLGTTGVPLQIDPQTGLLTCTPAVLGQFVIGVKVIAYRNGVRVDSTLRDFQFNVVPCQNLIVASIQSPTIACGGYTATFTNNSVNANSFSWDFGDPTTSNDTSTLTEPSWSYPDTGTYTVVLVAYNDTNPACNDTSWGDVIIYPPFQGGFIQTLQPCNDTVVFTDTSWSLDGSPVAWYWYFGDGDSSAQQNPVHPYDSAGNYPVTLIVLNSNGCTDTVQEMVSYLPSAVQATGSALSSCGSTLVSFSESSTGNDGIFWDFGDPSSTGDTANISNPVWTYPDTGSYTIMLIATNDSMPLCNDTSFIPVQIIPDFQASYNTLSPPCDQQVIFSDSTVLANDSAISWVWDFGDGGTGSGSVVPYSYQLPGTYPVMLIVTSAAGCIDTVTGSYTYSIDFPAFTASVTPQSIYEGQNVQLGLSPDTVGYTYQWSPSNELSDGSAPDPVATPVQNTTYTVTVTDSAGCYVVLEVNVLVEEIQCNDTYVYVPNAFTPNGDGENDILYLRGNNLESVYFAVYNRWGQKVFETRDKNNGWDGYYQNRPADPAVFDYYYDVTCTGGQRFFHKGNVTLMR